MVQAIAAVVVAEAMADDGTVAVAQQRWLSGALLIGRRGDVGIVVAKIDGLT